MIPAGVIMIKLTQLSFRNPGSWINYGQFVSAERFYRWLEINHGAIEIEGIRRSIALAAKAHQRVNAMDFVGQPVNGKKRRIVPSTIDEFFLMCSAAHCSR